MRDGEVGGDLVHQARGRRVQLGEAGERGRILGVCLDEGAKTFAETAGHQLDVAGILGQVHEGADVRAQAAVLDAVEVLDVDAAFAFEQDPERAVAEADDALDLDEAANGADLGHIGVFFGRVHLRDGDERGAAGEGGFDGGGLGQADGVVTHHHAGQEHQLTKGEDRMVAAHAGPRSAAGASGKGTGQGDRRPQAEGGALPVAEHPVWLRFAPSGEPACLASCC